VEIERYLRIPFAPRGADWGGCNCWGLVVLAYRHELGIALPAYAEIAADDLRGAAAAMAANGADWRVVTDPQPYDLVLMRGLSIVGGQSLAVRAHVGLVVPGGAVRHTEDGVGPAVLPLGDPFIARRIEGYRRHHVR